MQTIVISAPQMKRQGGWVLDTQFVTTMGMPYLLAHGLGNPVADAQTAFTVDTNANYHLFVYTFNWVAPWKPQYAPGIFKLGFDGSTHDHTFGATSPKWGWEYGGEVSLEKGEHTLTLIDQTGFEGRFGMAVLTEDKNLALPQTPEEVTAFCYAASNAATPLDQGSFDLVVCGAGYPGICASLSAARQGLRVALVQDRPVVGGNNSSEVRVWLGGETNFEPFPGIGNVVLELEQKKKGHYGSTNQGENYEDEKKLGLLLAEPNITLFTEHILTDVEMQDNAISSIVVWDYRNGQRKRLTAPLFLDSTGDATLGYLAGADFEVTTNGHMGMTNAWYIEDTGAPQAFPRCHWAVDLTDVDIPGRVGVKDVYNHEGEGSLGCWFWEGGCEQDPIFKAEYARDLNLRAMYGAVDALKNHDGSYPNHRLGFAAYIGGKRESRRLFGDILMTKSDVYKGVVYPDSCVPSTWNFDVHYPDRRFYAAFHEGDAFLTKDYHEHFNKPYFIPYRAMYSRNIANLFMAGRNISVSHDALGTVRVMRTGGMMGEVIGYAAALCKKHQCTPRQLYQNHNDELMATLKSIPKKGAADDGHHHFGD